MTNTSTLPKFRRVYVDRVEQLEELVQALAASDAAGVDAEMVQRVRRRPGGLQEWTNVLALIQIAAGDVSAVVDPIRCSDLSPLRDWFAGPVRKVFLGGGQDDTLLAQAGLPVRHVVDVGEIALSLFGRKEDGMAALARRIFGLSLDKTIRRADWVSRPLNPVLISYAHQDAELTLSIYRWMREHYPDVTRFHERVELEPMLPKTAPIWLQEAVARPSQDIMVVVAECGLDPATQAERLADDLAPYLAQARAPRVINRLLRIAGDLELHPLLPLALDLVHSPSALVRAAAARAIGFLADPETGVPVLKPLLDDPIAEVQKAAQLALGDIKTAAEPARSEPEDDAPSLGGDALAALERLKASLENQ